MNLTSEPAQYLHLHLVLTAAGDDGLPQHVGTGRLVPLTLASWYVHSSIFMIIFNLL